ncbi:MAG TPA: multiheme c-type cytochrome [Opitutus sp.]|nr:multiheme c-type cytochrome [Opitutus sp.]
MAVVLGAGLSLATQWQEAHAAKSVANRPLERLAGHYVSSDTCRSCHPGNYASWHASFHRTMTQVASAKTLIPEVTRQDLTLGGSVYRLERSGDGFAVRQRPAGAAAEFGPAHRVVLLTGSHTLQMLWTETGHERTLSQFPFAWLIAEKRWTPVAQTFLYPPGYPTIYAPGDWNISCINCHATQGRSRFVAEGVFDSQVSEFGIACESCHGEGREHIATNRNPARRYWLHLTGRPDPTIANPARLDGPRSALVCGQCHGVTAYDGMEAKLAWNESGTKFHPGDAYLSMKWVAQPHGTDHPEQRAFIREHSPDFFVDRFWSDGMVRVTGREFNAVAASPCFQGGHFSCLSCHTMHPAKTDPATFAPWRNQQLRPDGAGDAACTQCHGAIARDLVAHTHHPAASAGSRCYNCHMPHTVYGLLRGIRSHQVSSPTVAESVTVGRPNACNLCHLDQPLAWTAEKLDAWYGQKPPPLSAEDREIAAAVKWILKGHAGQRALVAWSMGWKPAQEASGKNWLYPLLALTLNDSYAAVRFDAWQSLRTLPGFTAFDYDYTADETVTRQSVITAYDRWQRDVRTAGETYPAPTLLDARGQISPNVLRQLLSERDNHDIFFAE